MPLRYVKSMGYWCKICFKIKSSNTSFNESKALKYELSNFETAIKIALICEGKCLSKIYIDNVSSLNWKCSEGHKWDTPLANIKNRGTWCQKCNIIKQLTGIEIAYKITHSRGEKCISNEYTNKKTLLSWICADRHLWCASLGRVKNGNSWCP